jgi:hypothetical protein
VTRAAYAAAAATGESDVSGEKSQSPSELQARGERDVREQGEIERPMVGPGSLVLLRGELVVHTQRGYVRIRVPHFVVFSAEPANKPFISG